MKKILIPTDFSGCANAASEVGLQIAQEASACVNFIHLCHTPGDWVKLSIEEEQQYPETKQRIGQAKAELSKWIKYAKSLGVEAEKTLAFTMEPEAILSHAEEHDCDLIVMGSHGASGIKEWLLGSNTQHIVRNAKVPVLVIKPPAKGFSVKQLLFASDFQEDIRLAFARIFSFAKLTGACVRLLYITDSENPEKIKETKTRMENILKEYPEIRGKVHLFNAANVEKGILDFAKDNGIDLITIATHGRRGIKGLFAETITERLVNHSGIPVLSVSLHN